MKFNFIDRAEAATSQETPEAVETHETVAGVAHETPAADAGVLASLGINSKLFGFQLINFLIVVGVVWFIILKPLTKKMAERQKLIDESLENAQKIQDKIAKGEKDYQERIDTAKVDANKIIEKATATAVELGEAMKEKAKADIEHLIGQAKRDIEAERDRTIVLVKKNAAEMVVAAVEKVLSEKLDGAKDQKLVQEMVSKIAYEEEK